MKIIPLFASTVLSLVGVAMAASGQQLAFDHAIPSDARSKTS